MSAYLIVEIIVKDLENYEAVKKFNPTYSCTIWREIPSAWWNDRDFRRNLESTTHRNYRI